MAYLAAQETLHDVGLGAFVRLMANFVALEAELGVALERVVGVLATQNAVGPTTLVGALLRHVAELLAVATLYGRVRLDIVARHLVLHLREHVVLAVFVVVARLLHRVDNLAILGLLLFFVRVNVPSKVHVTLDGPARDEQIRVPLCVDSGDVVGAVVSAHLAST